MKLSRTYILLTALSSALFFACGTTPVAEKVQEEIEPLEEVTDSQLEEETETEEESPELQFDDSQIIETIPTENVEESETTQNEEENFEIIGTEESEDDEEETSNIEESDTFEETADIFEEEPEAEELEEESEVLEETEDETEEQNDEEAGEEAAEELEESTEEELPVDEVPHIVISRNITGQAELTAEQLTEFFLFNNPDEDYDRVIRLARLYIEEAAVEGINSDVAFVQMCHETGFLRFGNLVTPDMNNFCGLGSIDTEHRGEIFETEQLGVRAHIQHLHAYATTEEVELTNELVDNRYKWVKPRGKAPTIFELTGTWAMDKNYAIKLDTFMCQIEELFTIEEPIEIFD